MQREQHASDKKLTGDKEAFQCDTDITAATYTVETARYCRELLLLTDCLADV